MNNDDNPNYSIGYRKPPTASQFKPGKSGNPRGRPRHRKNFKAVAREAFTSPVIVRQGTKTRRITKLEAILMTQIERALKGDQRAALAATKLAEQLGLFREPDPELNYDYAALTDDELNTLEQLMMKIRIRHA